MTCCGKVKLENFEYSNGIYILDPATREYKQENGDQILHQRKGGNEIGWFVGKETEALSPIGLQNPVGFCIYYV